MWVVRQLRLLGGTAAAVVVTSVAVALALAAVASVVFVSGCARGPGQPLVREPSPEIVEGGAVFRYVNTDAKRVFLVGDFNNWSPNSDPMKDLNGDGHWSLFYPLGPGAYQYKFVVDGRWIPDPRNRDSAPDGFDDINSVVVIPEVMPGS
jgi:1,4-alpha-glucan branching enzyme